jgi:hypothetical protein
MNEIQLVTATHTMEIKEQLDAEGPTGEQGFARTKKTTNNEMRKDHDDK